MKYRAEIDGLRAVAVTPVILFHAGVAGFPGGFVGVDVFFVISGFLITSLILHENAAGVFTLANFYERRARRILPALFVVVLACLPFAYAWMMPDDLKAFSSSALYTMLSVSNFAFYLKSGYFATAAELTPLLHTWSLAVEEQFYLLFPLLLLVLLKRSTFVVFFVLGGLFAASLFLAQVGGNFEPSHSPGPTAWSWQSQLSWGFYLLPTRIWELLIGAMIAIWLFRRAELALKQYRLSSEVLSLVGLSLIAYAVFAFDRTTPFPSVYSLVPTLGAGLVIVFAVPGTVVHRVLSMRVLVGLGLISYSFYLWHHPLFAFARIYSLNKPPTEVFFGLAVVAMALAYITWRFVERPFRDRTRVRTRSLFVGSAVAASVVVAFLMAGRETRGFQYRFPKGEFTVAGIGVAKNKCPRDRNRDDPTSACRYGEGEPAVAIVGDSHAHSLVRVLGHALGKRGTSVVDLHVAGCVPVRNFLRMYTGSRCRRQDTTLDYLIGNDRIKHVVVAVRWATKFEVFRFDNTEGGVELGDPTIVYPDTSRTSPQMNLADAVKGSIRELLDAGKTVILMYPIPEVGWDVPNHLAKLRMRGQLKGNVSTSYDVFRARTMRSVAALDAVGEHPRLHRVLPEKIFCNSRLPGRCLASMALKALYYDDNHLSAWGASMVVRQIVAKIGHASADDDGR